MRTFRRTSSTHRTSWPPPPPSSQKGPPLWSQCQTTSVGEVGKWALDNTRVSGVAGRWSCDPAGRCTGQQARERQPMAPARMAGCGGQAKSERGRGRERKGASISNMPAPDSVILGDIIRQHGLQYMCYADDTQIYLCLKAQDHSSASSQFENCITEVYSWMCANQLKMNESKTDFLHLSSKFRHRSSVPALNIIGSTVPSSSVQGILASSWTINCL